MLSTYPKEADAIRKGCEANAGVEVRGWLTKEKGAPGHSIRGRPVSIVGTFEEAFVTTRSTRGERYDVVLLAIPAPFHDTYLQKLAPYLRKSVDMDARESEMLPDMPKRLPTILAAAVAQGGFDMAARAALSDAGVSGEVIIAGLETLPWACRVARQGAVAEILGTKDSVDAAIAVFPSPENLKRYAPRALEALQIAVGPVPRLRLASGFLGVSLSNINAFWHPTLMWHKWRDWNGEPVPGPAPALYETAPDDLACDAMSSEVANVVRAIRERYPRERLVDDLSSARSVNKWFLDSYGDDPALDTTSTATMMRTNPAYRGLTHPMRSAGDADENLLVPDFAHRYVTEDVGYGLVVIRGVAELVGVPTPTIDAVIAWAQNQAGLHYLVEREIDKPGGELSYPAAEEPGSPGSVPRTSSTSPPPRLICAGTDLPKTRCPQRFGWFDLSWFMQSNGYAVEDARDGETHAGKVNGSAETIEPPVGSSAGGG